MRAHNTSGDGTQRVFHTDGAMHVRQYSASSSSFAEGLFQTFTGTGVNDNDLLFTTSDTGIYNTFELTTTSATGNVDVEVSLDGTSFSTVPIALEDQGSAAPTVYVVATAAVGRVYRFTGKYANVRVRQAGALAATAILRAAVS